MTIRITTNYRPGVFAGEIDRVRYAQAVAVSAGVRAGTEGAKLELRQDILRAGLGQRFASMVGSGFFPRNKPSLGAAGTIYPRGKRAELLLRVFSEGATIRSANGFFLAIPTDAAGRARTPFEFESNTGLKLHFVYRTSGPSLLVADDARMRKSGAAVKPGARTRTGRVSVVVFVLMPQVRIRKRLDPDVVVRRWADRIPELIERAAPKGI